MPSTETYKDLLESEKITLENFQRGLLNRVGMGYSVPQTLVAGRGMGKTSAMAAMAAMAVGPIPFRMAHPACPWPYGTIIRPRMSNAEADPWQRHMVIGTTGGETVASILLNGNTEGLGVPYVHLRETLLELWEEDA